MSSKGDSWLPTVMSLIAIADLAAAAHVGSVPLCLQGVVIAIIAHSMRMERRG